MKPTLIILFLAGCAAPTVKESSTVHAERDMATDETQPISWRRGADLNGDGKVNLLDWAIFTHWFGSEFEDVYYNRIDELEIRLIQAENRLRIVDPNWIR